MKKTIRLNILPLYRNKNIKDYDLFKHERNNINSLSLSWLDETLTRLAKEYKIKQIDISGGEISQLSDTYFTMLYTLCKIYCKKISITTDFNYINKGIINSCDIININYNFDEQPLLYDNLKAAINSGKIINIKSLDICCNIDTSFVIQKLNTFKIKSWEIIPYHMTKHTIPNFEDYLFFENVISKYLPLSKYMKFAFQNKLQLDNVLPIDNYNTHILYLTPNNTLAIQHFDKSNNFSLSEYSEIEEVVKKINELELLRDKYCAKCTSKLQCMANRFLNLEYQGPSCSGFKNLLANYKK